MVILFLISNYNPIYLTDNQTNKINESHSSLFIVPIISAGILIIFSAVFLITKNISDISKVIHEKEAEKQNEIIRNPMILPSYAVHIAVKKFYLGKKFEDDWSDKTYAEIELNEKKRARLKDKLSDNFLLKRSSDVILIIVAVSTSLLLLGNKKTEKNS
jgi:hypothetical protein